MHLNRVMCSLTEKKKEKKENISDKTNTHKYFQKNLPEMIHIINEEIQAKIHQDSHRRSTISKFEVTKRFDLHLF